MTTQLFPLGKINLTPGAMRMAQSGINLPHLIARHQSGDWGEMSPADRAENAASVEGGLRIFSDYQTELGKVWIITEASRTLTTVLLPDEY